MVMAPIRFIDTHETPLWGALPVTTIRSRPHVPLKENDRRYEDNWENGWKVLGNMAEHWKLVQLFLRKVRV